MSIEFNKGRLKLWNRELNHLFDLFEKFLNEFNLHLYSCSMGRITFCNDEFFFHVTYAYDRYQQESNLEMPLGMISFEKGTIKKNIIDVFKEKVSSIDIYEELRLLNEETKSQGLTYKILLDNYITPLINKNELF